MFPAYYRGINFFMSSMFYGEKRYPSKNSTFLGNLRESLVEKEEKLLKSGFLKTKLFKKRFTVNF